MSEEMVQDRRPIASRNAGWAIALTGELARRGVSANAISVMGMVACLMGGAALVWTGVGRGGGAEGLAVMDRGLLLFAAVMCQVRLVCNMLDGMVAIARGVASPVGALYNELPDRVSDIAILVGLGYGVMGDRELGWIAALLAVLTAYVRAAVKVSGGAGMAQDFCGP
ncbi:MAG: CDP-alcohol phosphatidyltransferase family protein, partial [Phycisphaerales bacterium]|nr:CDP-alcohol phosphatidyltransferase family protein [Phycisphaerales bacterium]